MRGTKLSLGQVLVAITSALTLIIALLAARSMYENWVELRNVRALNQASELGDRIFDAVEQLSVERDIAVSILHVADRDIADSLLPRLQESRDGADDALRLSLLSLDRFSLPELTPLRDKISARLATIRTLRPQVDAAVKLPAELRDPALAKRKSDEVTALIGDADALWTEFVKHFTGIDATATEHLWYKQYLRIITDYSGRERSLISQLIADNATPTPANIAELQRGQGIIDLSWQMSHMLADQGGILPVVAPYYADASSHYSTVHGMIEGLFYEPASGTTTVYPIGLDLWFELSNQAADSLSTLRKQSIMATGDYLHQLMAEAQANIAGAGAVFLFALLLSGWSFWIVTRRVIRPINQIIAALLAAMRGEEVSFAAPAGREDEIGKLADVLHAFQDKVEQIKRTSAELARSQSHLTAVVDHALDGLFTLDSCGLVTSFNPACERIFGYSAQEIIGRGVTLLMPEAVRAQYESYFVRDLAPGEEHVMEAVARELIARRKDGSLFHAELSISAFTLHDGLHISAIVRDITFRKEAERELQLYNRALERSNKELDEFAYIASHDLKEPLRGIHNHSRFLLEDNADKLDKDSIGRLNRLTYLTQRMERLVNDLLYFSRLGRQDLAVQPTDFNEVVKDIEETLENFLQEQGARLVVPQRLPVITCDKARVTEVFRNLITNAVKYSDRTERLVEIGCLDSRGGYDAARRPPVFYVKDNGKGIDPEFHEDIFRIFKRLQSAGETEEGTGVGLTFVKKIVERHGGRIWLESELGKGTTFYFTLEASPDEHDSAIQAA
jgi:PAS domain S-box-containing protein